MGAPNYTKSDKRLPIADLTGGLDTRHSVLVVENASKKKLKATTLQNVDFFKNGSVQKRLGKTQQGDQLVPVVSPLVSQTNSSSSYGVTPLSTEFAEYLYKFTAGSSASIGSATVKVAVSTSGAAALELYSDSAGSPGTRLAVSDTQNLVGDGFSYDVTFNFSSAPAITNGTTYWVGIVGYRGQAITLKTHASDTNGATRTSTGLSGAWTTGRKSPYIVVYSSTATTAITGIYDYRHGYAQTTEQLTTFNGNLYKRDKSAGAFINTWTSLANTLAAGQNYLNSFATFKDYAFCTDTSNKPAVVWDGVSTGAMRHGYRMTPPYTGYANNSNAGVTISSIAGSTLTIAANMPANGLYVGKTIWLYGSANISPEPVTVKAFHTTGTVGSATYYVTRITVEEQSPQTDHTSARWNGATITIGAGASGSMNASGALTCFSLLAVTKMKSGGYRASEFSFDLAVATANVKVTVSNYLSQGTADGTLFAFDVNRDGTIQGSTIWFMSEAFNPGNSTTTTNGVAPTFTHRKISSDTAYISTGLNPMADTYSTAFDIKDEVPAGNNTLLDEYGYPTVYFTAQKDAPKTKFFTVFQNFLVAAGDPAFPNRFYTSAADSPQIYSGAGGSYGSFYDIDANDGDQINGLGVWNNGLYIFKKHSVYYAEFTGVAEAPLTIRRLQGALGALSGFSVKSVDWGIVFLSERGPAYVSGAKVDLCPGAEDIQNLFDPNDASRFNQSVMQYSTCGHNSTKQQVWWGVATTNATNRDQILVFDYGNRAFWINTDSSNVLTEIGDANGFPSIWSGDYNGNIFQQESGATDNGSNIPFVYQSAWLTIGGIPGQEHIDRIWVAGDQQSSAATLTVDVYRNYETTAARTVTFDMTDARFPAGMQVPLNMQAQAIQFKLSATNAVPLKVNAVTLDYQERGSRV